MTSRQRTAVGFAGLSRREREVLAWVLMGLTSSQIGRELSISPKTVETHRTHIYGKLGLVHGGSMAQLYLEAISQGWIKRGDKGGVMLGFEYERRVAPSQYVTVSPSQ